MARIPARFNVIAVLGVYSPLGYDKVLVCVTWQCG